MFTQLNWKQLSVEISCWLDGVPVKAEWNKEKLRAYFKTLAGIDSKLSQPSDQILNSKQMSNFEKISKIYQDLGKIFIVFIIIKTSWKRRELQINWRQPTENVSYVLVKVQVNNFQKVSCHYSISVSICSSHLLPLFF